MNNALTSVWLPMLDTISQQVVQQLHHVELKSGIFDDVVIFVFIELPGRQTHVVVLRVAKEQYSPGYAGVIEELPGQMVQPGLVKRVVEAHFKSPW